MKALSNQISLALITSTILTLTLCNPAHGVFFQVTTVLNPEKASQVYNRLETQAQLYDLQAKPIPPTKGAPGGSR